MTEIYYVEDDRDIAFGVKKYLENKEFQVTILETVRAAKNVLDTKLPSLILVDWNLPDGSGQDLCKWIRNRWSELPVIFLTVKCDSRDMVAGLQGGADDYLIKPFDLEVLYARICAVMRRFGKVHGNYLNCGKISIDKNKLKVFWEEEEIILSQAEYQLLLLLMENKGKTLTRQRLLELIWDVNGSYVNDNTLTVTMKRLREKLYNPSCMKTVRSFGYRMEDE
ncbi:response regulator transcription factor [Desnuesiella massiliensis]|uniref:response regulator transcription factor n=1 Tax=Desnuesiella massiliensis TaxID=1650662 RepID=UPI0006E22852|nr:response regulator transcription factor [Desnuesiella massiliensis]